MTNFTEASTNVSRPTGSESFRLNAEDDILEVCSAASVSSDKQRIDAMFDETRSSIAGGSVCGVATYRGSEAATPPPGKGMRRAAGRKPSSASSMTESAGGYGSVVGYGSTTAGYGQTKPVGATSGRMSNGTAKSDSANAVQVRIEKMFAEISAGNAAGNPISAVSHRFTVDYLGAVPIADKVTTLQGLQEPLKELYLGYRKVVGNGSSGALWEPGFLEISKEGLKVHHGGRGGGRGQLDQLNPFPTIAVWAAVKFVSRLRANTSGYEFAFLPLIADPDGVDREALFHAMSTGEERALCPPGSSDSGAPMFAVVMRKVGVSRQLECHAFVCSSTEDAVVMAANLYQSLMTSMRHAAGSKPANPSRGPRMHHENGFGRISIAGSVCGDETAQPTTPTPPQTPSVKIPPPVPKRPPRKKKSVTNEPLPPVPPPVASLRGNFPSNNRDNRRPSLSKQTSNAIDTPAGDILTKVAIPRSRSFLHANGPLMRYGRRGDAALPAPPTASASPLGFHELFAEFRQQEGLESLDDILGAIIDAEGMSFNDLKPIYKEFLLKLALTLTKDELYQRSKTIMHKQKKKQKGEKRRRRGLGVAAAHIKRALRRTLGRLRLRARRKPRTRKSSSHKSSNYFNDVRPNQSRRSNNVTVSQTVENACNVNVNVSISNARGKSRIPRRRSVARRRSTNLDNPIHYRSSTSEESDFFTTIRCDAGVVNGPGAGVLNDSSPGHKGSANRNRPSSGYISYSDCGYDSESCTCASADRCYCSHRGCSCDTDSCMSSDKCYCSSRCRTRPRTRQRPSSSDKYQGGVLEQLKRQGFVASESSLSRAASPSTAWRRNENRLAAACAAASAGSVRSSKSLEFVQMWPARSRSRMDMYQTEDKKALLELDDREERRTTNQSASMVRERRSRQQRKMLVVSARDPKGRVIYMGASCRDELDESVALAAAAAAKASKPPMCQFFPRATITSNDRRSSAHRRRSNTSAAGDVFSVKKSAEIAALFANVKMSQTTDIVARSTDVTGTDTSTPTYSSLDGHTTPDFFAPARVRGGSSSNGAVRVGLESSLGYLP